MERDLKLVHSPITRVVVFLVGPPAFLYKIHGVSHDPDTAGTEYLIQVLPLLTEPIKLGKKKSKVTR